MVHIGTLKGRGGHAGQPLPQSLPQFTLHTYQAGLLLLQVRPLRGDDNAEHLIGETRRGDHEVEQSHLGGEGGGRVLGQDLGFS